MPNSTPRTIAELQAWYTAHNLPPEDVTRFFIGKDVRVPRAFGIYEDGGRFVVYKNKADGRRAVRYEGIDEGYAVNQLYMKLKEEIAAQKGLSGERRAKTRRNRRLFNAAVVILFAALFAYNLFTSLHEPKRGYYRSEDVWYYYMPGAWYYMDDDVWYPCGEEPAVAEQYQDYYVGEEAPVDGGFTDFETTRYYSTTDTDSTWDSAETWDSGSTDWNSDW